MTRKEELEELCGDNKEVKRLVEEVILRDAAAVYKLFETSFKCHT